MKKLLLIVVLIGAGIAAWKFATKESEAYVTYKAFAAAATEQKP